MTLITDQPYPPKEVFFLGAGASVSGGAPTFANFRDKAKEVLSKILQEGESGEKISLFQNVLNQWNENFADYNIEEYYSAVEMNEQLNHDESITTKNIVRFIAYTIEKSILKLNTPSYKLLVDYGIVKAIVTTNWDILLERSINESLGLAFDDNALLNYDDIIKPYHEVTPSQQSDGYIPPILKLHGSLNWGFCRKCGQIYYFNRKIYTQLISYNDVKCKKHENISLTPFIVPPTLSKLEKAEMNNEKSPYVPLRSIWTKASEYLRLCKKVYFIGYSFPETDVQMKIFISNALRKNENLEKIIIVSNPKYGRSRIDFEERYSPILLKTNNNPEVIFEYCGFEKFCENLSVSNRTLIY